jgi:predicted GNAT family acetyltransferase
MRYIKIYEEFINDKIKCDNCGWSWKLKDGGAHLYICHKCFHDNTSIVSEEYILKNLESEFNIDLDLYDGGNHLILSRIVVPKEQRGRGVGSDVMQKICDYADETGKKIYLTPSKDFGASSIKKLEDFYKGFGFVKKPKDDFSMRETMVRFPK